MTNLPFSSLPSSSTNPTSTDVLQYAVQAGGAQYVWNISSEENKSLEKITLGRYGNCSLSTRLFASRQLVSMPLVNLSTRLLIIMCIVEEGFRDDVFGIFRECVAVGVAGYYPYLGFGALRLIII